MLKGKPVISIFFRTGSDPIQQVREYFYCFGVLAVVFVGDSQVKLYIQVEIRIFALDRIQCFYSLGVFLQSDLGSAQKQSALRIIGVFLHYGTQEIGRFFISAGVNEG